MQYLYIREHPSVGSIRHLLPGKKGSPRTQADVQLYAEGLDQVQRLADARRSRLVAAEEGVPGVLWAVLVFGGMAAVGFTYLFGLENTWAHRLMVLTLAAVIGLVLLTIAPWSIPSPGAPVSAPRPSNWF